MLGLIFGKARQEAPCFLVFEDLDSIVSDNIRSFFLNEVDGLEDNDGILMVGSTNYLERLDPGISKRPSRFDRKYYFPNPDKEERIKYCEYWQRKLSDNRDIDFPHRLCLAIANITHGFSFAYMQEAFVAALLVIASHQDKPAGNGWNKRKGIRMWEDSSDQIADHTPPKDGNDDEDDLDKFILWREIKKQIKILRQSLDDKENADDKKEKADKKTKTNTFKLGKTNSRRIYRYPLTIPVPASPSRSISRNKAIENFAKIKAVSPTGPTFTESGGESNIQKLHRARETAAMEAESRNNLFNDPLQLDGASAEELLLFYSTSPLGEMGDVELGV